MDPVTRPDAPTPSISDDRIERDEMGEVRVPISALYGAQTQRAVENFPISGLRLDRPFIRALGLLKQAAAAANARLGILDASTAAAIESAAVEVIDGRHDAHFVVDVFQTGSGTSSNMNANEVIARLASTASGLMVHPNDHVNRSQSSNDVIPSALHIAAAEELHRRLLPAMHHLAKTFRVKADAFSGIVKVGRTHLQDAVPLYLSDEFGAYAYQVEAAATRLVGASAGLHELALGGTAVGTGLNAPAGFAAEAIRVLSTSTGLELREAANHFEAQGSRDATAMVSGALKAYAVALTKIGNDVRFLASGPRCGIGELNLPAVQPGSSIMPGKVNPVIIESMLMVCAQVIGNDAAITWCCAAGQLELNAMLPLLAYDVLQSIHLLTTATHNFAIRCIQGLTANPERIAELAHRSYAVATALTTEIGHEQAAAIAREAQETGATIHDVARNQSGLSDERVREILDIRRLAGER